jgi:hypothetical protein
MSGDNPPQNIYFATSQFILSSHILLTSFLLFEFYRHFINLSTADIDHDYGRPMYSESIAG